MTITPWYLSLENKTSLWRGLSFRAERYSQAQLNILCNHIWFKKTDISLFSIDDDHIVQYTGFSNVRPAPPAWSRDLCWEWLPVKEWRWLLLLQKGDVGFLKAQFGATRAFLYTQCCYVIQSTSLLPTSGDFSLTLSLSLLLFKKLGPNGSYSLRLIFRDIQ
jgi:hypothetical protein